MNVLFLTLIDIKNIDNRGIYEDLLREFVRNGHQVFVVSPTERRNRERTHTIKKQNCHILKVRTGNIQKTNLLEKGFATIRLESQFVNAIKTYYHSVKFDFVLYSTPPITIAKSVEWVKKRDSAKTYLLLKDIFPQNAVDMGMMKKKGIKGVLYNFFRRKEKKLYELSDYIGCMSQANVDYVLKHNQEISREKVGICPNCIEPRNMAVLSEKRIEIRRKYGIPEDKKVFVYGGNLGKPQGIHFLIECLKTQHKNNKVFFLIIGSGTEYEKIEAFVNSENPVNVKLLKKLPKDDYDKMVGSCDVGMIFLDYRFTIPNFPSRLLSYMQAKLPVLAVTDVCTDLGKVIAEGKFGWWCESNDTNQFKNLVNNIVTDDLQKYGINAYKYLLEHYSVQRAYYEIISSLDK